MGAESVAETESLSLSRRPAVTVRPLAEDDGDALAAFGAALPADDWLYLDIELQNRHAVDRLINAHAATNWRQVVAVVQGEIVGYANVRLLPGWQRHVGDAYLVIGPSQRRRGLGAFLARAIVEAGAELGVGKLILQMLEEQADGRQIFERLGFRQEGLLIDQARDQHGRLHNLLVLAYHLHHQPEGIALPG
ncbi:MAG: GNAT family N-acetyltransferase [Frankiaceae bacterium]